MTTFRLIWSFVLFLSFCHLSPLSAELLRIPLPDRVNKSTVMESIRSTIITKQYEVYSQKIKPLLKDLKIKPLLSTPLEYPQQVFDFANRYNENNISFKNLPDLTDIPFISIDNDDSKDIDQAMYISYLEGKHQYILMYAISNAEYFLENMNSPLAHYFLQKGLTTYSPAGVYPALPPVLSDNLCSLNEQRDRRSLLIQVVFDKDGKRLDALTEIYQAKVRNRVQLSYKQVAKYYENGSQIYWNPKREQNVAIDNEYLPTIHNLESLGKKLLNIRLKNKTMKFPNKEIHYKIVDENNKSYLILEENNRVITEFYNEEISLNANTAVAIYLKNHQRPGMHRFHESPDYKRAKKAIDIVNTYLQTIPSFDKVISDDESSYLDSILEVLDELKAQYGEKGTHYQWVQYQLMGLVPPAVFSASKTGHFGLQLEDYDQTTAPMRRAGDIINHLSAKDALTAWFAAKTPAQVTEKLNIFSEVLNEAEERERSIEKQTNDYFKSFILSHYENSNEEIPVTLLSWNDSFAVIALEEHPYISLKISFKDISNSKNFKAKFCKMPLEHRSFNAKFKKVQFKESKRGMSLTYKLALSYRS